MIDSLTQAIKRHLLFKLNRQSHMYRYFRAAYLSLDVFRNEIRTPGRSHLSVSYSEKMGKRHYSGDVTKARRTIYSDFILSEPREVTLDVFVPVYNRLDLVRKLLLSLTKQKVTLQNLNVTIQIYVGDDFSNPRTSTYLKLLCSELGVNYTRRSKNLGVVKNVNLGFADSKSDFFLLLNSDISIAEDFISRMFYPMLADDSLGAVTALTMSEIQKHVRVKPGDNWRVVDEFLGRLEAQVIDACTAISYTILINRKAIRTRDLMDEAYGIGYGEDSDLHYRIIENGFRSVWNLNLLVSHLGGGSFSISADHLYHQKHGNELFHSRWGGRYHAEIVQHEEELRIALEKIFSGNVSPSEQWVWIVSPAVNPRIGGLLVGALCVEELVRTYPFVSLVDISDTESQLVHDSFQTINSSEFRKKCKAGDKIIILGLGGIRWWEAHKNMLPSLESYFFMQGSDSVIDPSGVVDFEKAKKSFDHVITNSRFQSEISKESFPLSRLHQLELNTDDAFYSLPELSLCPDRRIDVLFCLRNEWGKGPNISKAYANFLGSRAKVAVFGTGDRNGIIESIEDLGDLSHTQLLSYLRSTKVYVDTSLFEGFGLIPREAADSGAFVFIMPYAGGTEPLLEYSNHFSTLGRFSNLPGSAQEILLASSRGICGGCEYCERSPKELIGTQLATILELKK